MATVNRSGRNFHLLAMSNMSAEGNASTTIELVSDALAGLWIYLSTKTKYEEEIAVPLLGTGAGRIRNSREEITRLIIDSFIVSAGESRCCDKLTIVIRESDFYKHEISLPELQKYLVHVCKYHVGRSPNPSAGAGNPLFN